MRLENPTRTYLAARLGWISGAKSPPPPMPLEWQTCSRVIRSSSRENCGVMSVSRSHAEPPTPPPVEVPQGNRFSEKWEEGSDGCCWLGHRRSPENTEVELTEVVSSAPADGGGKPPRLEGAWKAGGASQAPLDSQGIRRIKSGKIYGAKHKYVKTMYSNDLCGSQPMPERVVPTGTPKCLLPLC